jgi:hypothetical protein
MWNGRPGPVHVELPALVLYPTEDDETVPVTPPAAYGGTTRQASDAGSELPVVVLRLRGRTTLGATAFIVLANYAQRIRAAGGHLFLSGVGPDLLEQLQHAQPRRSPGRHDRGPGVRRSWNQPRRRTTTPRSGSPYTPASSALVGGGKGYVARR